jgi:hypothetical protein
MRDQGADGEGQIGTTVFGHQRGGRLQGTVQQAGREQGLGLVIAQADDGQIGAVVDLDDFAEGPWR